MTEAEWWASADPAAMLAFLARPAADRALRRFAVAACRRVEPFVAHPAVTAAIALAEEAADDDVSADRREAAERAARDVWGEFRRPNSARSAAGAAARAVGDDEDYALAVADWVRGAAASKAAEAAPKRTRAAAKDAIRAEAGAAELLALAGLLRDIIGNPFRPVSFDLAWRTSTAVAFAAQMYDSRDFTPMPVLADALQDVGCENADVLGHCRGSGPHVRGCWVVDALLGRG
jgi:hypothetical protein